MKKIVGTPKMIKLLNKDLIEGVIRHNGPITQPEIAEMTNLSLVTVTKTVAVLHAENKVICNGTKESTGGRKAATYAYNEELSYYIGLYFEKDVFIGAVSNSVGTIIFQTSYDARTDNYDSCMEDLFCAIDELIEKCGDHYIAAIGLGIPGVVHGGRVSEIPIIPCWEGENIYEVLFEKYKIPIFLENDVNLTVIGLYQAKYKKKYHNMALFYLDKGIGAGLIIRGELHSGSTNFAGELSYLPVDGHGEESNRKKYNGNFEQRLIMMNDLLEDMQTDEIQNFLLDTIVEGILSVICILNPEVVVLKNKNLKKKDLVAMTRKMEDFISAPNLPKLVIAEDLTAYSIQGVIDMCLMETTSSYSLYSGKGR